MLVCLTTNNALIRLMYVYNYSCMTPPHKKKNRVRSNDNYFVQHV